MIVSGVLIHLEHTHHFVCFQCSLRHAPPVFHRAELCPVEAISEAACIRVFAYSVAWGMGGLLEPDGRKAFHAKLCEVMEQAGEDGEDGSPEGGGRSDGSPSEGVSLTDA